jgi:plasmid stabilization system protein ParE
MNTRWSHEAADDLHRICERTASDSPDAAGCRDGELVFAPLPYIVVYLVTEVAVEITRIFHGAQDWP